MRYVAPRTRIDVREHRMRTFERVARVVIAYSRACLLHSIDFKAAIRI